MTRSIISNINSITFSQTPRLVSPSINPTSQSISIFAVALSRTSAIKVNFNTSTSSSTLISIGHSILTAFVIQRLSSTITSANPSISLINIIYTPSPLTIVNISNSISPANRFNVLFKAISTSSWNGFGLLLTNRRNNASESCLWNLSEIWIVRWKFKSRDLRVLLSV